MKETETNTQQQPPRKPKNAKQKAPAPAPKSFGSQLLSGALVFIALMVGYSLLADVFRSTKEEFTVSQLADAVKRGEVTRLVIEGDDVTATFMVPEGATDQTVPVEKTTTKEPGVSITETLAAYGVTSDLLSKPVLEVKQPSGFQVFLFAILPYLLMFAILVFVSLYFMRQFRGVGTQAMSFGQSRARITDPRDESSKVTFADVAGAKEAKEELMEIVDFLKNPKKFLQIGARIPKGVLMMGAPGTGKTLLARAVAGEANVPFFSISGSEFVEMFVGVGASRVRDLFRMAKTAAPAIIFIDEIDAVGRARGVGVGGGNDEREQTLNQILVEMDGFEPNEKVIVMAATNRPDVLDTAILRPGRFDRRVTIDLPDRADREEILKVQARGKPLAEDVSLRVIAERTPGFSGADLYSLVNEGAILAAREERKHVSQFDLIRSIEKVLLGPERRSHLLSKKEKELTAYHEAGHAVVASVLPNTDPVHKISVISRGRAAGYTLNLPLEDRHLQTRAEFLDDIAMTLGGYVTEKMMFGDVTTGPSNDLQVSTAKARNMVTKYGMSDALGAMAFEGGGSTLAGSGSGLDGREYSERVSADIDAEISLIMKNAYGVAEKIVTEHRALLDAIAKRLIEKETIERDEFESILVAHGITPKKAEYSEGIVIAD